MTEQPDNLVLEHLRNLRKDVNNHLDKVMNSVDLLTAEMRIKNAHVAGIVQSDVLCLRAISFE